MGSSTDFDLFMFLCLYVYILQILCAVICDQAVKHDILWRVTFWYSLSSIERTAYWQWRFLNVERGDLIT